MAQTGCTEEKAKEALTQENGDLINASEFRLFSGAGLVVGGSMAAVLVVFWSGLGQRPGWRVLMRRVVWGSGCA